MLQTLFCFIYISFVPVISKKQCKCDLWLMMLFSYLSNKFLRDVLIQSNWMGLKNSLWTHMAKFIKKNAQWEMWSEYNLSSKLRHVAYIVSKTTNWKLQWQSGMWFKTISKPSSVILRLCASFFPKPTCPYKIMIAWLHGISFLTNYLSGNLLKGTWDQTNNFCLKLSFFIIKQNCMPQAAYFVRSFACMTSLMSRYSLIIQNFSNS